jgi:hypothetical protein
VVMILGLDEDGGYGMIIMIVVAWSWSWCCFMWGLKEGSMYGVGMVMVI